MSTIDAIILGLVQGLTEFIPVSSSGHLILAREVFGIDSVEALGFDAVLQLATILGVIVYFIREIRGLLKNRIYTLAIVLGTIPAVVFGIFLEDHMETVFRSTTLVAWTLLLGALLMYAAEKYGKQDKPLTTKRGFVIGLFQALALVPGISRSGATISGGLFSGLSRVGATKFSFLLAVPVILGSGVKKLLDLNQNGSFGELGVPLLAGSLVAFVSGLLAIHFLLAYLKNHKLTIFVWYRVILSLVILLFL